MLTNQQPTTSDSGFADDSDYEKKPDVNILNSNFTDAESCDQDIFAEQRSNVLLASGEHYNRKQSRFFKQIRDNKELSQQQKIRLVKNHIRKICQIYSNNILSANPGVGFSPKDENSLHDQKVSELHHSVWRDAVERYNIPDKMDDWVDSFTQIGEMCVKLFYDPNLGDVKGYEAQTDPEGNPVFNEVGQQVPDETKPVFSGEFVFEEVYGFNLLRPPECKDMRKAEWICIRKMANRQELLRRFRHIDNIKAKVKADQDETYMVFDALNGGYKKSSKQTMIREFYYRPSVQFPNGYYYVATKEAILDEGELPGGLFPIVFAAFDKIQTTPRGRSPIKTMRPYQVEINRSASKMAEHQITLGDDKILLQNGTKISAGAALPGIRGVNYTGAEPKILAGRDGSQYLNYMQSQITELYQVMMVAEDSVEAEGKLDPYILLFRSAKQKKKFQRYIGRFEKFMVELVKLYISLAKFHMPDDAIVWAVGKNEQVNIPEFKQLPDTCYEVKIEAQSDDIEEKMGKQIVLNHALQYVGTQLKPDDIGKIMRAMPFANFDGSFDDMTMDYDSSVNDMLALDRGERPPVNQYDNHVYCIKRLTSRTRKPDFKNLSPQIQQSYQMKIQLHQQMEAANQASIQRAQQGFIPTGGYLVTCDFYVPDPSDPAKTRRARVPYESMAWLLDQMTAQGQSQDQIAQMELGSGSQAAIANQMLVQKENAPQMQQMNPMAGQPQGPRPNGSPHMAMG